MISISEASSKRITSLRFLLMFLVMIKHNAIVRGLFISDIPFNEPVWITFIKEFSAKGLGELAVPVFFIFSAYLFFSSDDSYFVGLKKRFYSIFIPYVIWTVLYFCVWLILQKLRILQAENPVLNWREWSFFDYLKRFIGYSDFFRFPFVGSFWFLRDLMVLMIFSPVLRFSIKRFPVVTIGVTTFNYFFGILPPLLRQCSLFYFIVGLFFVVYKIDFFVVLDKIRWYDVLIAFFLGFIIFWFYRDSFSYFLYLFSGIIALLKLSDILVKNENIFAYTKWLVPYTFFVYAFHMPVLVALVKHLTLRILPVESYGGVFCLLQFIFACAIDIGLSLLAAVVFKKLLPRIFDILSGGNREK